jgi:hypothetical protein
MFSEKVASSFRKLTGFQKSIHPPTFVPWQDAGRVVGLDHNKSQQHCFPDLVQNVVTQ